MQELAHINKGYFNKCEKQWLHTRSIMASVINCFSKESISPSDLVPLELDKLCPKLKPRTEEELKEIDAIFHKAENLTEFQNWLKLKNNGKQ